MHRRALVQSLPLLLLAFAPLASFSQQVLAKSHDEYCTCDRCGKE